MYGAARVANSGGDLKSDLDASRRVALSRRRSALTIFLAHSRAQEDHARSLQQALNCFDFPSCLDVIDMSEGREYSEVCAEIDEGFERATHFVVLVTSEYLSKSSRYCLYEINKLISFDESRAGKVLLVKDSSCDDLDFDKFSRGHFVVEELQCSVFDSGSPEAFSSAVKIVVEFLDGFDASIQS